MTFDDPTGNADPEALNYNYFAVDDKLILKDHSVSSKISAIIPRASSLNDNFYISNGLYLDSLGESAMRKAAEDSYAACGHIAIMCSPDVLRSILASDDLYFDLVSYAYGSSVKHTSYIYNDKSGVIEIFPRKN